MKKLIKAMLPQPMMNMARQTRDVLGLVRAPQRSFDASRLRLASSIAIERIFADGEIAAAYEQDHAEISALFGDIDRYGGVNPGDRRALYFLIMALKPHNVLEVGTHIGASTLYIARALKRIGHGGRLTTVDILDVNHPQSGPWKRLALDGSPRDFASKLGCADLITFHTGPCQDFMLKEEEAYDFLFLDGDHKADAVYNEVSCALSILAEEGMILLHDYYPDGRALYPDNNVIYGPCEALKRIRRENDLIEVLPLGALPWLTKQGSHATSLALVTKVTADKPAV